MQNARYNPFTQSLQDFAAEELARLRAVTEGWFVEYKSAPISARDFGKHISAFSNQFGGWLFVGVKEGEAKSLKAESFPGIPSAEVGEVLSTIRDGVAAHVTPTLFFEHRVIDGPVSAIELAEGKSVVVIQVPEGSNPPYVHSSGRIYRRVGDSSDPKHETDRAVLDAMWRKSEEVRKQTERFVNDPIRQVHDAPFCHVYLMEDLSFSGPKYFLSLENFRQAMTPDLSEPGYSITLNNTFSTQDGYVGRHRFPDHNPLHELVSLRWWYDGNVRMTVPIGVIQDRGFGTPSDLQFTSFLQCMGLHRKMYGRILNLDQWLIGLIALGGRYLSLRDSLRSNAPVWGKIGFSNVLRSTPFVSMDSYLRMVHDHGLPVIQDAVNITPPGSVNVFTQLHVSEEKDGFTRNLGLMLPLITSGMRSLGVLCDLDESRSNEYAEDLIKAINKGAGPQRHW